MHHDAKVLRATLTASLMLVAVATAAVAGPFQDALAAWKRGDYATEYSLLRPLADQGNADAQFSLGDMYLQGHFVQKDYAKAVKWFRLAADQGNGNAQTALGAIYAEGKVVSQDYTEAVKWLRLAADQGIPGAQANLGHMYAEGQGVPQDYVQAHMWYNLAASRFTKTFEQEPRDMAVKSRDALASVMTPAQIAEAQKLAREWKPER